MDRQISKVKKDLEKGEKDVKKLQVMDKKNDKKIDRYESMMKSKKK